MKQLFFVTLFFLFESSLIAQTGALKVINHNATCSFTVIMHAQSTAMGSTSCGDIVANIFTIPAATTLSWADPYDFESAYLGGGGGVGAVGWYSCPSGGPCGCTVCGTSCFCWLGWVYYPTASWSWTYATIDFTSCSCEPAGYLGAGCAGSTTTLTGCTASEHATISASSTYPYNITIDLY